MQKNIFFIMAALLLLGDTIAGVTEINPTPLFIIDGLGNGYSSPTVTSDRIFVTGEIDSTGYLFAYDPEGNLLWKTAYGKEWAENFPGSRSSPAIADSSVYISSGMGDITCLDIKTGKTRWTVNMIRDLHGTNAVFGYSVPVLIDNERIYCLPGGSDTNIVCLNRFTGRIIWVSSGSGKTPGYASPILAHHHNRDLLVTFMEMSLVGLDAGTGEVLWTHELSIIGDAPCNDPIYSEGYLYAVAGSGNGAVKLEISGDGSAVKKVWSNKDFNTYFGGVVKTGNFLYGASDSRRIWRSIDAGTGRSVDSLSFRTGATVAAGQDLVLYNQNGKVGLVRTDKGKMKLAFTFGIEKGTGEHFAHPVVAGERLYIRHGNALIVYDYQKINNPGNGGLK